MIKLKPCPFCGGNAKLMAPGYKHYLLHRYSPHWCKCTQCGAEGPVKASDSEAVEGWNKRAEEANDAERIPHGCWLPSEIPHEKYVCSHCGGACWYYDYEGIVARSRFCPNCGAKMDEKER